MQRRRHPGERDRRYLAALNQWGYQPSDVERLVLTKPTEASTEASTEATAEANQVVGTDTLDADPTTCEGNPEDVAGGDTGESGESAFGDDGWIKDDEVRGGWRGDDQDAEAQP